MSLPLEPPIKPMLATIAERLPEGGDCLFEPKWDGFRAIVFRGRQELYIQSRDLRPLDRYFPELREPLLKSLPPGTVIDGEIVVATAQGLDFDALQQRLHPAASRVARLARETPASFVGFDLLASAWKNVMAMSQERRRARLEKALARTPPPVYLTPMTRERSLAASWLDRFEGAGLDGVVAKRVDLPYQPGKRAMLKIKHVRTAECVVAGFRWHRASPGLVGSLLLGLYDDGGVLQHIGVTSGFTLRFRAELARLLEPLRRNARRSHPWRRWEDAGPQDARMPGARSRWTGGRDLAWEPVRIERVCEVTYDHLQGHRFRHAAHFVRWRLDKAPSDCRYDQLETVPPYELRAVFGGTVQASPTLAPGA